MSQAHGSSLAEVKARATAHATSYFETGQFQTDLAHLVRYETESQVPDKAPELWRYLEEAIMPRLSRNGFTNTLHPNPVPGGGPFLVADRQEAGHLPTLLTYGHGDVIRAQTDQWRAGLHPFQLTEEDGRLYGRGSADNKAQHLINIAALEAVLAVKARLGFNMKILIEMSEEIGSPGLHAFCAKNRAALFGDVLIASDGPRLEPETPTMFMGSRGAVSFDLVVDLREGAHHSGNWGGLLADPAIILAHAIASITDARGQIQIPEWRPNSLTEDIKAVLRSLPPLVGGTPAVDLDWGEGNLTPAERAFGWNSFAVLAMKSGVPEAPVNAISAHARATCQLRYVVGTDPNDILPALRRHLASEGLPQVAVLEKDEGSFAATRLSPDHPWAQRVRRSLEHTAGKPPHVLPNLAGSLPNDVFADVLGLPTIWVPHSYRGCSQHAPNEHLLKATCLNALHVMAGLYCDLDGSG